MTNRPNILLLMADQHRGDALGAAQVASGAWQQPAIQTPHLDQLGREGVRFARAYTESPVCVSARATLLTGLLPHRTGVFDNGYKVGPDAQTLPKLLRERGYFGQAIGKMHFSPVREHHGLHRLWLSEEIPARPENDEFLTDLMAAGYGHVEEPHGIRHEMYYVPQVSQLPEHLHTTAWTGRKTVEFLEEHVRERRGSGGRRGGGQPFFCWTSFVKPHPPFDPPVPWHTLYRPTDLPLGMPVRIEAELDRHTYYHRTQNRFKWTDYQPDTNLLRTMRAYYAACVSFIDFWVGQILQTLERLDLRENTLVLYVADHGEYLGDHYAFGKRGYHDPACRIPFIASWPGQLPQGEVRHQLVGLADLLPTCVVAADGSPAARPALDVDGMELLSLARDGAVRGRDVLIGQLAEKGKGLYLAMDEQWKYVYSAPDDREYLLHRGGGEGPSCDRNEYDDHAADPAAQPILERLRAALVERFRRDGYADPLDDADPAGLRRFPGPQLPWEPLDEMEDRSVVARGWQYAAWNRNAPYDTAAHDRRLHPAKAVYRFPSRQVRY
ncbi:MAG: sulfatase-like hydrolase/transferase [Chloroflexi bacterium]|nr:sulfatase-like hydrolase/transferase [Chloroflexota bacterium]